MVRKAVRPYSAIVTKFEELDVKDAKIRAYYEPMSKEEVAALKLGRGSSLIRSKHRHADILHWEDDISTIATVDASPGERAMLAMAMRTRSASGHRCGGSAALGGGKDAWAPSDAAQADPASSSTGVLSGGASTAPAAAVVAAAASSPAGLALLGGYDGVLLARPRSARPPSGRTCNRPTSGLPAPATGKAQDTSQGPWAAPGAGGSHDDPIHGPPLSQALRAALQGAARSITRPMSAQPPSSLPRSKLIEQYIQAQRLRPQSASEQPPGVSPDAKADFHLHAGEDKQGLSEAPQGARDEAASSEQSPSACQQQRRLIRFESGLENKGDDLDKHKGSGHDGKTQQHENQDQQQQQQHHQQHQASQLGKDRHAHSAPVTRSAVFGRSTIMGLSSAQGREFVAAASGAAGETGAGPGGGHGGSSKHGPGNAGHDSGPGSLVALLGGTGGVANVPLGLLQMAAEAEADAVEDVEEGMDGEDDFMLGQSWTGRSRCTSPPHAHSSPHRQAHSTQHTQGLVCPNAMSLTQLPRKGQLSVESRLQYFGHCGQGSSRNSSARRRRDSALRARSATVATAAAVDAPHSCPASVVPAAVGLRRATSAPRASVAGSTAVPGQPLGGPLFSPPRVSSAPRARPGSAVSSRDAMQARPGSATLAGDRRGFVAGPHDLRVSPARATRPVSARHQLLLLQQRNTAQQQQQQQQQKEQQQQQLQGAQFYEGGTQLQLHKRRPASAGPQTPLRSSEILSRLPLQSIHTSVSKASDHSQKSPRLPSSPGRSSIQQQLSLSASFLHSSPLRINHLSTAGFPAEVHRGVGEGHDPHYVKRSPSSHATSSCRATYNPEKAAAVYGVRSAARRELMQGLAAAALQGRSPHTQGAMHDTAGAAAHTGPSVQAERGPTGGGVGEGDGVVHNLSNGVLTRSPVGPNVTTHKGLRQQQWLHLRQLHSMQDQEQLQRAYNEGVVREAGKASNRRPHSGGREADGRFGGDGVGAGSRCVGDSGIEWDHVTNNRPANKVRPWSGPRKQLGGWPSAQPASHYKTATHRHNSHSDSSSIGASSLGRPASAPLPVMFRNPVPTATSLNTAGHSTMVVSHGVVTLNLDSGAPPATHARTAAVPPPPPPGAPPLPAAHASTATSPSLPALPINSTTPPETSAPNVSSGIPPSLLAAPQTLPPRPVSASSRPLSASAEAGAGEAGGLDQGSSSSRPGSGRPLSAKAGGCVCVGTGTKVGVGEQQEAGGKEGLKQTDWEFKCERQELGIVDEDSGEGGSDSDGL